MPNKGLRQITEEQYNVTVHAYSQIWDTPCCIPRCCQTTANSFHNQCPIIQRASKTWQKVLGLITTMLQTWHLKECSRSKTSINKIHSLRLFSVAWRKLKSKSGLGGRYTKATLIHRSFRASSIQRHSLELTFLVPQQLNGRFRPPKQCGRKGHFPLEFFAMWYVNVGQGAAGKALGFTQCLLWDYK